ncbi:MAG: response regulator [Candidatus Marinimicrobia bacterium]|nr:response regulator [Candidatus Neomarinimicrobiota bacterium]
MNRPDFLSADAKYRFIFDHFIDLIMVCDAGFTIIESNEAANIVLGKGESLIGEKCHQVLRQNNRPCVDCPLRDTVNSGTVIPLVKYDNRFNEYFEERCFPILSETEELDSFIITVKNITKSRELEEKSTQMKKLTALGQISSGVAHDFNNVLTVVLGRVQLMKRLSSDPYFLKSLDMIEKSALDGASKVRKIQEFSRPSSKTLNESVNLKNIIEEVVEITRPKWDAASTIKGILIEPILELNDDLFILGDSSDLRNAFTNIIFNAIDAMPNGGILSIKTEQMDNYIHVNFKDTGIGMTEETIERVFDPFFTTKGVLGSGLGMSEVYGIIKRHNGKTYIQSEAGNGTTIKIRFPSAKQSVEKISAAAVAQTNTFSIYIIDDEEYILETLRDFLSDLGHTIHTNTDPRQALADIKKNTFDIVITDLGMPGINGLELAENIKSINPRIQVILISGWALNLNESDLENRIDFVLNKPFSFEKITFTLSEVGKKLAASNRKASS